MRSTSDCENARRMAQWRATGGAGDGLGAASYTGRYGITCGTDDGLAALWATSRATCHADDGLTACELTAGPQRCWGHDGLAAPMPTMWNPSAPGCADDGLRTASSNPITTGCRFDDWLAAAGPSAAYASPHLCGYADDGLAPRMGTVGGAPSTLCAADDGLTAGNPSEPTGCFYGDDGLTAGNPSDPTGCFYGDDGLKAAGGSFLHGDCFADDGLKATHPTYPCADDGFSARA